MTNQNDSSNDPRQHSLRTRREFDDMISRLRDAVSDTDDPQAKALFETAAEVIGGLSKAFKHFEERSEEAWKV